MGQLFTYVKRKATEDISFVQLTDELRHSKYVVALTGAGVSAESGIPTFRDPHDGLWDKYDPSTYATIWGFWRDPAKIWELIRDFLRDNDPKPNPSHTALADLERLGYLKSIITQNVDNLHQDAGSQRVIEFHGNLMTAKCYSCGCMMNLTKEMMKDDSFTSRLPPKCRCGGNIKPDVILFGESIPRKAMKEANEEAKKCDVMLVVGTSASVSPASDIPYSAMSNGAKVIEVNLSPTTLTNRISDKIVLGRSSDLTKTVDALRRGVE